MRGGEPSGGDKDEQSVFTREAAKYQWLVLEQKAGARSSKGRPKLTTNTEKNECYNDGFFLLPCAAAIWDIQR